MPFPDTLEIKPLTGPPRAVIHVPGSKSITNRALDRRQAGPTAPAQGLFLMRVFYE